MGGTGVTPTATVQLRNVADGKVHLDAATGDGPIDAAFSCILRLTGIDARLQEYDLRAVTGGKEAQGEVRVQVRHNGDVFGARGISTDILEASALAYIDATNRLMSRKRRLQAPGRRRKRGRKAAAK